VSIMSRTDDVMNVAGHRLSTGQIEGSTTNAASDSRGTRGGRVQIAGSRPSPLFFNACLFRVCVLLQRFSPTTPPWPSAPSWLCWTSCEATCRWDWWF
jgi:hypothetical protein